MLTLIVLSFVNACASHYIKKTRSTDQEITAINLEAVRFFRPDYPVADHDDFSNQTHVLDCQTPKNIWSELLSDQGTKSAIECLNSLKSGTAHYLFISKVQPALELDPLTKEQPDCLLKTLPKIPLPREVYFLAKRKDQTLEDVFSMSFDTKASQLMDAELRVPRFEVLIPFPVSRRLKSAEDLELWLLVTSLSLFKSEGKLMASAVPEMTWKQCFKDDPRFSDKKKGAIPGLFWP